MKHKNHHKLAGQKLLIVASLFFFMLFIWAYRHNNVVMIRLRDEVYRADKNNGDTETALRNLRQHIYTHMNTDLTTDTGIKPPIQLQYTYERLVMAEKTRVAAINSKVYTEAQEHCERTNPTSFSGSGRIGCIQEYVSSRGEKERAIPDGLYKFDFVSARWSFDLAGWSMVAAAGFLLAFLARLLHHKHRHEKLTSF